MTFPSHGLFETATGDWELRFGVATMFSGIWSASLPFDKRTPAAWPFRRIDQRFSHLQEALRDAVWKLEHVAMLYAAAAADYSRHLDLQNSNFWPYQKSLSVHMDSTIVYLRILPDILAALTPYLYPQQKGDIAGRSFRVQAKWLLAHPDFDPGYSAIVNHEFGWFELLAGKNGRGIRDTLVHRFGRFQHPVVTSPPEVRGYVGSDMVTDAGYVQDAQRIVTKVAAGLCRFLDAFAVHHSDRILGAAGWTPLPAGDARSGYLMTFGSLPLSKWLLPRHGGLR